MKAHTHKILAIGGLGALLLGAAGMTPARADHGYDRAMRAVHHDLDQINRDQHHLNDLVRKADDQKFRGDWRGLNKTRDQIDHARMDLQRDKANLRVDQQTVDGYHRF